MSANNDDKLCSGHNTGTVPLWSWIGSTYLTSL